MTTTATVTPHAEMVAFMREHGGFTGALNFLFGAAQQIGGKDARMACIFGEWIAERRQEIERSLPPDVQAEFCAEVRNIHWPQW